MATPCMPERISFCHLVPPNPCHKPVDSSAPHEISYSYFFPDILFWDPLSRTPSLKGFLKCLREACSGKTASLWSPCGKTDGNNPRRLYGLTCPVMLVSRVYRCQLHNHEIIAHDCGVLKQLLDVDRYS